MENSRLFGSVADLHSAGDFYSLVSGERLDRHGAPARAAWKLEQLAALRGWPAGETLGSEAWLRARLGVSRETLREAIRIVESRGAMRMQRGRSGGLMLLRPPIERTAAFLAAYLRATELTDEQFAQSVRGFDQLVSWAIARNGGPLPTRKSGEGLRHWLARASGRQTYLIYISALDQLAPPSASFQRVSPALDRALAQRDAAGIFRLLDGLPFIPEPHPNDFSEANSRARAGTIAVAMVERAKAFGTAILGNEASLCEAFATSRSLVRQALRILQDLDMICVKLGRGGGYALKQPSPIGVIRQVFAWLAARNCDPFALNDLMWDLNSANLRLAGERLAAMSPEERLRRCEIFDQIAVETHGRARFIRLQQVLAQIADCPMIDTLARCVVSYQARSYGDFPDTGPSAAFKAMERVIIAALRRCEIDKAERVLRSFQIQAEEVMLESLGLRAAAE